jgi:hypothetical protein
MNRIVSKAQYMWLQRHLTIMRSSGVHYDEKRRLTRSKIEYLLGATDYNALPERITRWRCAH